MMFLCSWIIGIRALYRLRLDLDQFFGFKILLRRYATSVADRACFILGGPVIRV